MRWRRFPPASGLARSIEHARLSTRLWTWRWRALPDFLIIGAQRAGTTTLFRHMERHPSIRGAPVKEVHYFDAHASYGVDWYRAHFPLRRPGAVVGEATPYYLFHPCVPARVRDTLPSAKLIALLRNPADRALSHYRHERRLGFESAPTPAEAIEREAARLSGEEERLRSEDDYFSEAHNHHSYLARGHYAAQLRAWYDFFPREQLLVLGSERVFRDPASELARVWAFLGVAPLDLGPLPHFNQAPASAAPTSRSDRERLMAYFRPHNQELYELLGEDLGWEA